MTKPVLFLAAGAVCGLFVSLSSAFAQGGEVLSAKQVSETEVEITLSSPYWCNDPVTELKYLFSNRASFGPHFYQVNVTGTNRMHCGGSEEMKATLALPPSLRPGQVLVLTGDNDTSARLTIE
jgi:hypothetical protein